ncbi:MAG: thioredoxin domain-containing protein [Proteobacteria bacterium]|nr:thioredoxin domain-containing protein [Pseudomonadota bacterium]
MKNDKGNIFSDKGFYLGVSVFLLGLILMILRVVLDVNSISTDRHIEEKPLPEQQISENINYLQNRLDEKLKEQEEKNNLSYSKEDKIKNIEIFEHNPIKNAKKGLISVIEFVDLNCISCLADAQFVDNILNKRNDIRFISKLSNTTPDKKLHFANLAGLIAAQEGKFFEFRQKLLSKRTITLETIIDDLEKSGVPLRTFRQAISKHSEELLNNLSQDINQYQELGLKEYTLVINGVIFSNDEKSQYQLSDIHGYLKNY